MPGKCGCDVCGHRDEMLAKRASANQQAAEKRRYLKETGIGTKGTLTVKTLEKMWANS